jgi:hypothetical protein
MRRAFDGRTELDHRCREGRALWRRMGPPQGCLLRIEIDHNHPQPLAYQTASQLHGQCGLPRTALLGQHSHNLGSSHNASNR